VRKIYGKKKSMKKSDQRKKKETSNLKIYHLRKKRIFICFFSFLSCFDECDDMLIGILLNLFWTKCKNFEWWDWSTIGSWLVRTSIETHFLIQTFLRNTIRLVLFQKSGRIKKFEKFELQSQNTKLLLLLKFQKRKWFRYLIENYDKINI
jgi:hypothetical protein